NCALASKAVSGKISSSTENDLSSLAFTWRFSKSEKYLLMEWTTDDKWQVLSYVKAYVSFLPANTIDSAGKIDT
ncbi:unnamed protein product, partial [Dicrocoelium dendriticum]